MVRRAICRRCCVAPDGQTPILTAGRASSGTQMSVVIIEATPFEDSGTCHTEADQRGLLYTPRLGRLTSAGRWPLTELAGEPEEQAFELQAVGHAAAAFEVAVGVGKAGEELVSAGPAQAFQVAF